MKKKYIIPQAHKVEVLPEYMLAQSQQFGATGADVTMDAESDFDSFFGS